MLDEPERVRLPPKGSQSIIRALNVLKCFAVEQPSLSVKSLTQLTGLNSATTHRMVNALEAEGFLQRRPDSLQYTLGPWMARLRPLAVSDDSDLVQIAKPVMAELRDSTGETVRLYLASGYQRVCICEVASEHEERLTRGIGSVYPLIHGAAGRVIVARMSDERVAELVARYNDAAEFVVTTESMLAALAPARRQGYDISSEEVVVGANVLAAAVDPGDGRLGSISVVGPKQRWCMPRLRRSATDLLASVAEVEGRLANRRRGA